MAAKKPLPEEKTLTPDDKPLAPIDKKPSTRGKSTGEKIPLATRATVKAMANMGFSKAAIAKRCEMSWHTVKAILEGDDDAIEQAAAARIKEALPATLRLGAAKILEHIVDPDTIEKASLRDSAVSLGVLIDKARLEAGETTEHVGLVLNIQAKADADYISSLKSAAPAAEIEDATPVEALPAPVEPEAIEAKPAWSKSGKSVRRCTSKKGKKNARS